jgi:site-specific DNA-methyltransferase (adenine-specific)
MSNIGQFKYDWIWYKNTASGFPFAKYQPLRNHEIISVFYKKRPYYNPIKEERDATLESKKRMTYKFNGNHKTDVYDLNSVEHNLDNKSYPKTIKRFKSVPNSKGRLHPTQKPVALLKYLIKTYTKENDTVLDFTMGSGSTGVACMETNRNFIGIELEPKYYEIAEQRINEAKAQRRLI